jgi:Ca2+-binding EF-hand superfamily protein
MTAAGEVVFDVLDTDGSGTIGPDEYDQFLRVYGLDDSRATEAFAIFDTDGNGSLSRDEFAVLIADFFVAEDPSAPGNAIFGPL